MGRKLEARRAAYLKTLHATPEATTQLHLLKAKLHMAQLDYDTTPTGITTLQQALQENPEDTTIARRLTRATLTREHQIIALKETRNGRLNTLSEIYTHITPQFDKDELYSIIETTRDETNQNQIHSTLNALTLSGGTYTTPEEATQNITEQYHQYITELENHPTVPKHLTQQLRHQPTPDPTTLKTYQNITQNITKAYHQLNKQIQETSTLQNTTPQIARQYYDAYRNQYKTMYANKPAGKQPNPPENWVKGDFPHSGYSQNPNSKYAPHDKASMYAIHRLQADETAIPDHMKQTRSYAGLTKTSTGETQIHTYTPAGKKIRTTTITTPHTLQAELEGKTLIRPTGKTPTTISLTDYVAKHFDYPNYTTKYVAELHDTQPNEAELFFTLKKKTKRIWDSKTSRQTAPTVQINL